MAGEVINFYASCDRAIQVMNRENLKAFGKLKLAKFDELNVLKVVAEVYRKSASRAKRHYFEVAYEVYVRVLIMLEIESARSHQMAEKAITREWVEEKLSQTDVVTLYRFDTETERKIQRLVEALGGTQNRDAEIDRALRLWSRQVGQYAINFTDYAVLDAYRDAGVKRVMWITQRDERVCEECSELNGMVFDIDEVPAKPHPGCRCYWVPVKE